MSKRWVFASLLILFSQASALASEFRPLYRGTRAQAMGGAYVGLADDEQAIFLNPAGMAGNKKYSFHYASFDTSFSGDTVTTARDSVKAFKNFGFQTLNIMMGKNIFMQEQITSMFLMPNFGVGILIDGQAALYSKNTAYPQMIMGYQTTNGIQGAFGFSVGKARKSKTELRFGIGAKVLWRRGGYHLLSLADMISADMDTLSRLSGNYQMGIGVDLGTQYIYQASRALKLSLGAAYTEIGDVAFNASTAASQRGNLTVGGAAQLDFGRLMLTTTYDYAHILDVTDWRKKSHFGLEIGLPMVSIYGGINQTYLSYGASFDVWLLKITAVSYAEELGSFAFQDSNRRYLMKLAMKFDIN